VRRWLPYGLLAAVVVATLALTAGRGTSPSAEARVRRITHELRCPVCEGLSVADSPSETAKAIVTDVRRRVRAGESDASIRRYYIDRYGTSILLRPTGSGIDAVVWALPVGALVLGAGGLVLAFRRWQRQPAMHATDADRLLVEQARHPNA
jgi:cytochrome c-type biogenesis protein CcmH